MIIYKSNQGLKPRKYGNNMLYGVAGDDIAHDSLRIILDLIVYE